MEKNINFSFPFRRFNVNDKNYNVLKTTKRTEDNKLILNTLKDVFTKQGTDLNRWELFLTDVLRYNYKTDKKIKNLIDKLYIMNMFKDKKTFNYDIEFDLDLSYTQIGDILGKYDNYNEFFFKEMGEYYDEIRIPDNIPATLKKTKLLSKDIQLINNYLYDTARIQLKLAKMNFLGLQNKDDFEFIYNIISAKYNIGFIFMELTDEKDDTLLMQRMKENNLLGQNELNHITNKVKYFPERFNNSNDAREQLLKRLYPNLFGDHIFNVNMFQMINAINTITKLTGTDFSFPIITPEFLIYKPFDDTNKEEDKKIKEGETKEVETKEGDKGKEEKYEGEGEREEDDEEEEEEDEGKGKNTLNIKYIDTYESTSSSSAYNIDKSDNRKSQVSTDYEIYDIELFFYNLKEVYVIDKNTNNVNYEAYWVDMNNYNKEEHLLVKVYKNKENTNKMFVAEEEKENMISSDNLEFLGYPKKREKEKK